MVVVVVVVVVMEVVGRGVRARGQEGKRPRSQEAKRQRGQEAKGVRLGERHEAGAEPPPSSSRAPDVAGAEALLAAGRGAAGGVLDAHHNLVRQLVHPGSRHLWEKGEG